MGSGGACMNRNDQRTASEVTRVLVVDDHPDTAEVLTMMFTMLGHDTCCALRGRDALRIARTFEPDMIVLDIGLPDINGYEVVHALRASPRLRDCFIVAVSGRARPQDIARARQAGFDEFVIKPIDLARIRHIIRMAGSAARVAIERRANYVGRRGTTVRDRSAPVAAGDGSFPAQGPATRASYCGISEIAVASASGFVEAGS